METFNEKQALKLIRQFDFDYEPINRNDKNSEYIGIIFKNYDEIVGYIRNGNNGVIIQFDECNYSVTIDQVTNEGAIGTISTQDLGNTISYKYDFAKQLHLFRLMNLERDIVVSLSTNGITLRDGEKVKRLNIDGIEDKLSAVQYLRREIPELLCDQVKLRK
jgi:hypothetical protein